MQTNTPTVNLFYYLVETTDTCLTWIGGEAKPDGDRHLWLTNPDGKPVLRVPRSQVTRTTPEETAQRLIADRRAAAERWN